MKKLLTMVLAAITSILPSSLVGVVRYNYSYYGEVIHSAPGFAYATSFGAYTLKTSDGVSVRMDKPEDMCIFDNFIYITSQSNNLIIVDSEFNLVSDINEFEVAYNVETEVTQTPLDDKGNKIPLDSSGNPTAVPARYAVTLNKPNGIAVNEKHIWICDTDNERVLKLNREYQVVASYHDIDEATIKEKSFKPTKITVDSSERMYVVVSNIYEGIVELDTDGTFNRYTGVNPVSINAWDIIVRALMTEKQLEQLQRVLPTSFTNVNMDNENFIYATAKYDDETSAVKTIQRINPKGLDVLRRNGYHNPSGDVQVNGRGNNFVTVTGASQLVDIAYTTNGIYTVLDAKRARLFTYDSEGYLLYVNGDEGGQSDKFSTQASAVAYLGDDLLVLDKESANVIVYQLTEFGKTVNEAIIEQDNGNFEEASKKWKQVLVLNTNYEVAYNGLGKYNLMEKQYKEAIENFAYGHYKYYYSKAYKEYRNEGLKKAFAPIVISLFVIIVGWQVSKFVIKKKRERDEEL